MKTFQYLLCLAAVPLVLGSAACRAPYRWTTTPRPQDKPIRQRDFNLDWDKHGTDPNGSPADPEWFPQRTLSTSYPATDPGPCDDEHKYNHPFNSKCTDQQPVRDSADFFPNNLFCSLTSRTPLHAQWDVAEYEGEIEWLNYAADLDYNLKLFPRDQSGLTKKNYPKDDKLNKFTELEFDAREVADRFRTDWWRTFVKKADTNDATEVLAYLNPTHPESRPRAVVVGLLGLDCEHGCRSELHPVYVLAVEVNRGPEASRWAIFVRNWGNGGFCSGYNNELESNGVLSIVLPFDSHVKPYVRWQLKWSTLGEWTNSSLNPQFCFQDGEGENGMGPAEHRVTFRLPPPETRPLEEMCLELGEALPSAHSGGCVPQQAAVRGIQSAPTEGTADISASQAESAEEYIGALRFAKEKPAQKLDRRKIFSRFAPAGMMNDPRFGLGRGDADRGVEDLIGGCLTPLEKSAYLRQPGRETSVVWMNSFQRTTGRSFGTLPTVKSRLRRDDVKRERDKALLKYVCDLYTNPQGKSQLPEDRIPGLNKRLCGSAKLRPAASK